MQRDLCPTQGAGSRVIGRGHVAGADDARQAETMATGSGNLGDALVAPA